MSPKRQYSLEGKLAAVTVSLIVLAAVLTLGLTLWLDSPLLAAAAAITLLLAPAVLVARWFMRPIVRTLQAVSDGINSIKDRDFSVSITTSDTIELGGLVASYNGLGDLLRAERQSLYQRELLLDTVIQATPLAMVLTNANDSVIYSNVAARQAFLGGRALEGVEFKQLLSGAPEPLRQAINASTDTLFTIDSDGESDIYH